MRCSTASGLCCGWGGMLALVALLAWLGVPMAIAGLSTIGLGLTVVSPFLIPVIIGALVLIGWGLLLARRNHGRAESLMIHLVGSVATIIGLLAWAPIAILGFVAVLGAVAMSTYHLMGAQPVPRGL